MTPAALMPRESSEYIVKNAKYLNVLSSGIEKLASEICLGISEKRIGVENFSQHELHPNAQDAHAIEWIFVIDTLNFCFWTPTNYTKYQVNGYTGYFALCAAINRAMKENVDITNAEIYSTIDEDKVQHIFRSDDGETKIPLLKERMACLHEVGETLIGKWNGKFENVLKAAKGSALSLLELIITEFPCFRDEANYGSQRVGIYKRAQILIGDIWSCFRGKPPGDFCDVDKITMFADYRVPQVLVHFGCLEYNPALLKILEKDEIMQSGDEMEVEIRGASIYIVEKVKEKAESLLSKQFPDIPSHKVNSILIDHFLWDYRRKHAKELDQIPFHKVISIYY